MATVNTSHLYEIVGGGVIIAAAVVGLAMGKRRKDKSQTGEAAQTPIPNPKIEAPKVQNPPAHTASPKAEAKPSDSMSFEGDLLTDAAPFITATSKLLEEFNTTGDQAMMAKTYLRIRALAERTRSAKLDYAARASSGLEALLKRMHLNPTNISASTLSTVSSALKLLEEMYSKGVEEKLANSPPFKILVVEDETLAQRAVIGALQPTFGKSDSADDGDIALELASRKVYDVIFSDIEMPTMNGFSLCAKIRESGPNQSTPIVFVTSRTDSDSRSQAFQSGATDFIPKPFLPIELSVKAMTLALQGRLRRTSAEENLKIQSKPELVQTRTMVSLASA